MSKHTKTTSTVTTQSSIIKGRLTVHDLMIALDGAPPEATVVVRTTDSQREGMWSDVTITWDPRHTRYDWQVDSDE